MPTKADRVRELREQSVEIGEHGGRVDRNLLGQPVEPKNDVKSRLPRKGVFYMAGTNALFPSLGGIAHKIKDNVKNVQMRYDVHPACEPATWPTDGPFKGGITINLPFAPGQDAPEPAKPEDPRCPLCVEGKQAWPEARQRGSRRQADRARPAGATRQLPWAKPKAGLEGVAAFYSTIYRLFEEGKTAEEIPSLIPDDVRFQAVKDYLAYHNFPEGTIDQLFTVKVAAKPKRPAKSVAEVKAQVAEVVEEAPTPAAADEAAEQVIAQAEPEVQAEVGVEPTAEAQADEPMADVESNEPAPAE